MITLSVFRWLCFFSAFLAIGAPAVVAQRDRDTWTAASPSSFEVSGQVRLAASGLPATRIPIRLERFGGGIVDQIDTDGSGRFRFPNLSRGYYKIVVVVPGFRTVQQDADLQTLFRVHLIFDLVSDADLKAAAPADVIDAKAPPEARRDFDRARLAVSKGHHAEAIEDLNRAVSIYPQYFSAHFLLANAFMGLRDWKGAELALGQALEIKPDDLSVHCLLGEVYWRQKRFDDAEKLLNEIIKTDDHAWQAHFTLGRLYWESGNVMKAAASIGRTLQLKPDFAGAHLLAGNILLKLGEQQRAQVEYEEYLRLAPRGEFVTEVRDLVQKLKSQNPK